jgi:hypothetical protein
MDEDLLESLDNLKVYKILISCIDEDEEEYSEFTSRLESYHDFEWENLSKPNLNLEDLKKLAEEADAVIILSGLYSKDPDLVKRYIQAAKELEKPIIAIRPWGMENVPSYVENSVSDVVGWNAPCIVDALRSVLDADYEEEGSCPLFDKD